MSIEAQIRRIFQMQRTDAASKLHLARNALARAVKAYRAAKLRAWAVDEVERDFNKVMKRKPK